MLVDVRVCVLVPAAQLLDILSIYASHTLRVFRIGKIIFSRVILVIYAFHVSSLNAFGVELLRGSDEIA